MNLVAQLCFEYIKNLQEWCSQDVQCRGSNSKKPIHTSSDLNKVHFWKFPWREPSFKPSSTLPTYTNFDTTIQVAPKTPLLLVILYENHQEEECPDAVDQRLCFACDQVV